MKTDIQKITAVAAEVDGRIRTYSGRAMWGKECMSIYCDDAIECIEAAAARGIRGARRDSMGRGAVVYWPAIAVPEGFDE